MDVIPKQVITFHIELIGAANGRSAVQLASYNGRTKIHRNRDGQLYDGTRKRQDLCHSEILLPLHAPNIFYDRETLWNAVELKEKGTRAQYARAIYCSLPGELDLETDIIMVRNYAHEYYVNQGMCADIAIHDKGQGKPHAHILLTTRALDENGDWMFKQRKNYLRNEDGTKIIDPETGRYKLGRSIKPNDWDDPGNAEKWRKGWADGCNRELERLNREKRVTHMSYKRQGSDRIPTVYMGAVAMELEKRGIKTDRGDINREITRRNQKRELARQQYEHERTLERAYERSR